jgi:cytochrome P450
VSVTDPQRTTGCPVITLNTGEGGKQPGEWVRIFDGLRAQSSVLFDDFGPAGGFYILTRHDDILEVLQDAETFSSKAVTVFDPDPSYQWIPEMLDPPEHTRWRQQLGPLFSPKTVDGLSDKVRSRAVELIEGLQGKSSVDYAAEFSNIFPTSIFLELLGLPVGELDKFLEWEDGILHGDTGTPEGLEKQGEAMMTVKKYFGELIAQRRAEPRDDIVSRALTFDVGGRPPTEQELASFCLLMFMAGLDTVTQNLNYIMYHLATHPEDRRRIVEDPSLIPTAIEECIRAYSIVAPARKATKDTEIAGCPIKKGQMILTPLASANRDDDFMPDGATVKIDRHPNNHISFGAGPHRCLGSHLARREMQVALEEWHTRFPEYRLADGADIKEHGNMFGLDTVPLVLGS